MMFLRFIIPLILPLLSSSLRCGFSSFDGCIECKSDSSGCKVCEAFNDTLQTQGYSESSGSCVKCLQDGSQSILTGCSKCDGQTSCNSSGCVTGYYFSAGKCLECPADQHCADCENSSVCKTCQTGYFLEKQSCSPCSKLYDSCQECTTSSCTKCGDYNLKLTQGSCEPCLDSRCVQCTADKCLACDSGYYPDGKLCQPCSVTNCSFCPVDVCQACVQPLALNDSLWPLECIECSKAETLLTVGCSQCEYDQDNERFVCLKCQEGYFLKDGNCTACPENCATCLDTNRCLSCKTNFILKKTNSSFYSCEKNCDTSTKENLQSNGTCYVCNAYYSGNCVKCDQNLCLECAAPTPYLRPPLNISCETCDLAATDLLQDNEGVCLQTPTAQIISMTANSDSVYYAYLTCKVPSTIYIVISLEWSSSTTTASGISLGTLKNMTNNSMEIWIERDYSDPYWSVYGKVRTDSAGIFYGPVNATTKLSGDIYDMKIWCVSNSGARSSLPVTKQFYPQYNQGYVSVIGLKLNNTLTSEEKIMIGTQLFKALKLESAKRLLYTDEGVEINATFAYSRRLQETSNNTNSSSSNTSTQTQVTYQYFYYSPPNWTLSSDVYDETISELVLEDSFLNELNQQMSSRLNATVFSSVSAESRDEQSEPTFASTLPAVVNTNQSLQLKLQINKADGYILVGVAESEPNLLVNGNLIAQNSTTLEQRIPSWEQLLSKKNAIGSAFVGFIRTYSADGSKTVFTFSQNLTNNTKYDIYFAATNSDFPFVQKTGVYAIGTFTMMNVFGGRIEGGVTLIIAVLGIFLILI